MKGNSAVKDVAAHARQMLPAPELFLCCPNVHSSLGITHVLYAGKEQFLCSPALLQHSELFRSANFLPRSSKLITYVCSVLLLPSQVNAVLVREDIYSSLEAKILNPAQPEPTAALLKEARQQRWNCFLINAATELFHCLFESKNILY